MPAQDCMHRLTQLPDPFAVYDPHFQDAFPSAGGEVGQDDLLHLLRAKGVQIQDPIDRYWNRLIHGL